MRPVITSFWMICTGATYHLHDRRECVTALFAGMIAFFSAFIELVAVSVAAVGMAGAGGGENLPDICEAVTAVSQ